MGLEDEVARRRQIINDEIRRRQTEAGHESPIPSFLNVITDEVIALQMKVELLEGGSTPRG